MCELGNSSGTAWTNTETFTTATNKFDDLYVNPATAGELINVFPNPNSGRFVLAMQGLDEAVDVRVTDLSGKLVFVRSGTSEVQMAIDLDSQAHGMYFVQITGDRVRHVERVVVQ